ncbi:MAG: YdbL family protein [Alphaproteobacteria bacterium]
MKTFKKTSLLTLFLMLFALPAMALGLADARKQGMVGEKTDGYVAAIKASGDVNSLVSEVNAKRKAEYTRISKENGQPVDVVAKLASPQIIEGLPAGSLYQGSDGVWKTR